MCVSAKESLQDSVWFPTFAPGFFHPATRPGLTQMRPLLHPASAKTALARGVLRRGLDLGQGLARRASRGELIRRARTHPRIILVMAPPEKRVFSSRRQRRPQPSEALTSTLRFRPPAWPSRSNPCLPCHALWRSTNGREQRLRKAAGYQQPRPQPTPAADLSVPSAV